MSCQEALEQMSAALDGPAAGAGGPDDGDGPEAQALHRHLLSCERCRVQQLELRVVHAQLRRLKARPATPASLRARIHGQCRQNRARCGQLIDRPGLSAATTPTTAPSPRKRPRSRTGWGMGLTGAAAALFALFVVGVGPLGGLLPGGRTSVPAELSASAAIQGAGGDGACRLAVAGVSPVAVACASNGRRGARLEMERITQLARNRGMDVQCKSCHLDVRGFQLLEGARERLASLLEVTRT